MYKDFYTLSEMPFTINTNPRFLWLGEKHQEALAHLKYGLLEADGYVVLTGDVGVGKTTLVNALLADIDDSVLTVSLSHPTLAVDEFFRFLARSWGGPASVSGKEEFLFFFKEFLQTTRREDKTVLLIIDEAHRLSEELLEEIRLLSNMEVEGSRLINIFFVGQNELKDILTRQCFRALRQRITLFYDIEPLSLQETARYIRHRLHIAGGEASLFSREAIRKIYDFTKGYPRLINILCGRAMLTGYVRDQHHIDGAMVAECTEELKFLDPWSTDIRGAEDLTYQQQLRQQVIMPGLRQPDDIDSQPQESEHPRRQSLPVEKNLGAVRRRKAGALSAGLLLVAVFAGIFAVNPFRQEKKEWLEKFEPREWLAVSASFLAEKTPPRLVALFKPKEKPFPASFPALEAEPAAGESELRQEQEQAGSLPADGAVDEEAAVAANGSQQPDPAQEIKHVELPERATAKDPEQAQAPPPKIEVSVEAETESLWELASAALTNNNFQTAIDLLESTDAADLQGSERYGRLYSRALVGRAEKILAASPQEAESLLHRALEANRDNGRASFVLAKIYTGQKNYASAITAYQKAGEIDPDQPDSFFNLGFLYAATGIYDKAEQNFIRAIALDPPYLGKALFNLAVIQERLGKREASLENLQRAKLHSPENNKIEQFMEKILAQEERKQ